MSRLFDGDETYHELVIQYKPRMRVVPRRPSASIQAHTQARLPFTQRTMQLSLLSFKFQSRNLRGLAISLQKLSAGFVTHAAIDRFQVSHFRPVVMEIEIGGRSEKPLGGQESAAVDQECMGSNASSCSFALSFPLQLPSFCRNLSHVGGSK